MIKSSLFSNFAKFISALMLIYVYTQNYVIILQLCERYLKVATISFSLKDSTSVARKELVNNMLARPSPDEIHHVGALKIAFTFT